MKIALLGEYSGFYSNLKRGFIRLGHEAVLISAQDSFKNIPDIDFEIGKSNSPYFRKFQIFFELLSVVTKLIRYDYVLVNNPRFFGPWYISPFFVAILYFTNRRVFLSASGEDVAYIRYGLRGGFRWWHYDECDGCPGIDAAPFRSVTDRFQNWCMLLVTQRVIPTSYAYWLAWKAFNPKKTSPAISLPFDIDIDTGIGNLTNIARRKIRVLHGLNRPCHNGTRFIEPALRRLSSMYPDEVEVIIEGNLPLAEYLELVDSSDVIVDQCLGYDHQSMNTLYCLSRGKLVLTSFVPESFAYFGISEAAPVIPIRPSIENVFESLEAVILKRCDEEDQAVRSRDFLRRYHASDLIARQYIDVFSGSVSRV